MKSYLVCLYFCISHFHSKKLQLPKVSLHKLLYTLSIRLQRTLEGSLLHISNRLIETTHLQDLIIEKVFIKLRYNRNIFKVRIVCCMIHSVWCKTTLITGSVGGTGKDPLTCKVRAFFSYLVYSALALVISKIKVGSPVKPIWSRPQFCIKTWSYMSGKLRECSNFKNLFVKNYKNLGFLGQSEL